MASKFGILAKLYFLHDLASWIISSINISIFHNIGKYVTLAKAFSYTSMESVEGDYLEFGVYTGSSFAHAIRCNSKACSRYSAKTKTNFFGFDSFDGFGKLDKNDEHPFFKDNNFKTDYSFVANRIKKIAGKESVTLVKGFFSDTLSCGPSKFNIKKAKVIFIDCDTYTAAKDVFLFVKDLVQEGTVIIIDDLICYKGNEGKGVTLAFNEFIEYTKIEVRTCFSYGLGAAAYIVSKTNN